VPLERVSVLLGRTSIKVTEKHDAPWIRARQEQLEADLERSWARDPIMLADEGYTRGTQQKGGRQLIDMKADIVVSRAGLEPDTPLWPL